MSGAAPRLAQISKTAFSKEVYPPAEDSFVLCDALLADLPQLQAVRVCLEVGSGSGYVITSAALLLGGRAACFATDINPAAVAATRATLRQHGVQAEVVLADLAAAFEERLHQAVDLLLFNPPYVPSPLDEVGGPRLSAAWAGGERGRQVLDRLLPRLPGLLAPCGAAYLVAVPANDVPQLLEALALLGLPASVCLTRVADEERLMVIRVQRQLL